MKSILLGLIGLALMAAYTPLAPFEQEAQAADYPRDAGANG